MAIDKQAATNNLKTALDAVYEEIEKYRKGDGTWAWTELGRDVDEDGDSVYQHADARKLLSKAINPSREDVLAGVARAKKARYVRELREAKKREAVAREYTGLVEDNQDSN
jgi:hypothetical protein